MNQKNVAQKVLGKIARTVLPDRDPRMKLLKRLPKSSIGAEIGVWKGEFSVKILEVAAPKELHLIDPWQFQGEFPERMFGGTVAKEQKDMDDIYESVKRKFADRNNVTFHRGFSDQVLDEFPDDYFDWIYVDGNHYYEYVMKDLQLSLQKVKPGGFITGDDYTWGYSAEGKDHHPVEQAVQEFAQEKGLAERLEVFDTQFIIQT